MLYYSLLFPIGLDGGASMVWSNSISGTEVTGTVGGLVSVPPFPACADNESFVTTTLCTDWLFPTNSALWQTGSILDPCPVGYQVPSLDEWAAELPGISNICQAYDQLAVTAAGYRFF